MQINCHNRYPVPQQRQLVFLRLIRGRRNEQEVTERQPYRESSKRAGTPVIREGKLQEVGLTLAASGFPDR